MCLQELWHVAAPLWLLRRVVVHNVVMHSVGALRSPHRGHLHSGQRPAKMKDSGIKQKRKQSPENPPRKSPQKIPSENTLKNLQP